MRKVFIFFILLVLLLVITSKVYAKDIITYSEASERHEINKTHGWLTLYSGTRYIEEDKKWIPIEEAKSLKDNFKVVYLEQDPRYEIKNIDFNYTHIINLELKANVGGSIPIKFDNKHYVTPSFNSGQTININNIYRGDKTLSSNITFGSASTTITLEDGSSEIIADAYLSFANQRDNYGAGDDVQMGAGIDGYNSMDRGIIKANITQLPAGQTIELAKLWGWYNARDIYASDMIVSSYHVYNQTWPELNISFSTLPCGANITIASQCNLTAMSNETFLTGVDYWANWDITTAVSKDYIAGNPNMSILLAPFDETTDQIIGARVRSRSYVTTTLRPIINITYSAEPTPPTIDDVSINPTIVYASNGTLECGAMVTELDIGSANINFNWYYQDKGAGEYSFNASELGIAVTSGAYGNTTININSTWLDYDDNWICQAEAYDGEGSNFDNSSSLTILRVLPSINIIYPVNGTSYTDNITEMTFTYSEETPDKCFYSLNYDDNITLASCDLNITGINTAEGRNNWTMWINNTGGGIGKDTIRFDVERWVENTNLFSNNVYETANESFEINITLREGASFYSAEFFYNTTKYPVSDILISGDSFNLTKHIDIPLGENTYDNQTNEFIWSFIYTSGTQQIAQNTTPNYQNVTFINLELYNATFDDEALNFTFKDELTGLELNASKNLTSIEATFNYWLGSGSVYKTYSYANISSAVSQYLFSIYPSTHTLITDMDMEYSAIGYDPRTYYLREAPLDNITNQIDLDLLNSDDSVKFYFEVVRGMLAFDNAIITISKYNTGLDIYETIGIRETDDNGEFIEYLELDKKYRFFISKDGVSYGSIDRTSSCEEAPCEMILQVAEAVESVWSGYYDVYATNVAYTLSYDDTNKLVTYDFTDLTGLSQYFRLLVSQISYNETGDTICNKFLYTTSGSLTCNMTDQEGDFTATGYISRSPETIENIVDIIRFIISTIKDTLGATGILMSMFIIITIALVGAWKPSVGVVLIMFAVLMMKILGFVAIGYTTIILIVIMGGILVFNMKR